MYRLTVYWYFIYFCVCCAFGAQYLRTFARAKHVQKLNNKPRHTHTFIQHTKFRKCVETQRAATQLLNNLFTHYFTHHHTKPKSPSLCVRDSCVGHAHRRCVVFNRRLQLSPDFVVVARTSRKRTLSVRAVQSELNSNKILHANVCASTGPSQSWPMPTSSEHHFAFVYASTVAQR